MGTCPKCEDEVRYLEQQLRARSLAGKAIALAGISAGMIFMPGCSGASSDKTSNALQGEPATAVELPAPADSVKKAEQAVENAEEPVGEDAAVPKNSRGIPERYESVGEISYEKQDGYRAMYKGSSFPGGSNAFDKFIAANLHNPPEWAGLGINGDIIVNLEIGPDGKITDLSILQCNIPDKYSQSALKEMRRLVSIMPTFVPATRDGVPVASDYPFTLYFESPN